MGIINVKFFKKIGDNLIPVDYCACFILSIIFPISTMLLKNQSISFSVVLFFEIITAFIGLLLFMALVRHFIKNLYQKNIPNNRFLVFLNHIFNSKYCTLWLALIIFIFWLPSIIALYPGTLVNDTWGQLAQVRLLQNNEWAFSSHHPIFDTIIMSIIIIPVSSLFGNWHIGFFAYTVLQIICTCFVFSYSITYMKKRFNQNNILSLIFLLIYCLFPIFIASAQTVSKDALSAWIYVLFVIQFIEIIRTQGNSLKFNKNLLAFIAICLLCILTKKIESYVIIFSLLSVLIFQRKNRVRLLYPMIIISAFTFIAIPVVQQTFNIQPSGIQEMLSLPFQQTARTVKENSSSITEQEKEVLEKVLDYDNIAEAYRIENADHVKGYVQKGETKDYIAYLFTWLKQGFRYPLSYLKATGAHLAGWYSYTMYKPLTNMNFHGQLNPNLIPEDSWQRSPFFTHTTSIFDNAYEFIYKIPIIGIILTFAFNATIIPYFIFSNLIFGRKNKINRKYLLAFIPMISTLIIGCYLAPVSTLPEGMRYLYPITYSSPIMLMLSIQIFLSHKKGQYKTT